MDTFPRDKEPVCGCELNARRAKTLWAKAQKLRRLGLDAILAQHDAMTAYELLEAHGML